MAHGDKILEHETRKMIYNHILEYPGVSFNTLKKVLNLTDSTLRYHLTSLIRAEKIRFGLEKGKRNYFSKQYYKGLDSLDSGHTERIKLSHKQEQLLNIIKQKPLITQKELIKRSGLNRFTIINNMKKLISLELVKKTPNGNNVYYEFITNEQLKYQILKKLVFKLLKKEISEEKFIELKRKLEIE